MDQMGQGDQMEMDIRIPFLFDAVLTNVEVFGVEFPEPQYLSAKLKFMGKTLKLTSSRVNVSGFVANREYEFLSEPDTLRDTLEKNGVELNLFYQSTNLGTASVVFPMEFLGKISPAMNDLLREDTVDITRRKKVLGSLSILFRLTIKCEGEPLIPGSLAELQDRQRKGSHVSCSGQGTTINPQDVMFIVGDPDPLLQIPSEHSSELRLEVGDERLNLDLERYRSHNRRVVFPQDDPCLQQKPSFSRLRQLTAEYSQIIDSVAEKVMGLECSPGAETSPSTTSSSRTPEEERWIPVPLRSEPEEDMAGVKPIRYCPVCLYSMSWLPKYMPCPRCNTKSRPVLPEPEEQMTAMQIVAEQLVRPRVPQGDEEFCLGPCLTSLRKVKNKGGEEDVCPPCFCTCTINKICAHCRVRKMCEEIYQGAPPSARQSLAPKPGPDEDFCVIAESQDDDLPYLSRVFHEMKHLYELHDFKKLSALELRCQSQTLLPRRSIKELTEDLYQGHKPWSTFDHRQKAGHKRCLPPKSAVSRHHGWNWTTTPEARTKGWRPGAILRTSGHVMRYFLMYKDRNLPAYQRICSEENHRQRMAQPVLNVCKRNGEIFVTLRPLATLGKRQKPITFRIVKSQLAVALRQIKRALKDQGFEKCVCHKSLMLCTCRDAVEKFELNKALRRECRRRLMDPCPEHLVLTDTSVSDMEFDLDVTPPAGTRWLRKPICNAVNHSTQTELQPPQLPPLYPVPVNPYYRPVDCAVGDRYMGTSFGLPGEEVFEDGVFGLKDGGLHGPNPMPCGRTKLADGTAFGRGRRHVHREHRTGPWKGFPAKTGMEKGGPSDPIPVRYPKRLLKPALDAAKAAKQAEIDALEKKKKGPDMIKYLEKTGTLRRPWNPVEGKDTRPRPPKRTKRETGCLTL